MRKLVLSLFTNFYKSFDNGIILVVISSMIPILLLGMTVIVDEAFAQRQVTPNSDTSVSASTPVRSSQIQITLSSDTSVSPSIPDIGSQSQLPHSSTSVSPSIPAIGSQSGFSLSGLVKNEKISSVLMNKIQKEKILLSSKSLQVSELSRIVIKSSSNSQDYLDQLKNMGVDIELIYEDLIQVSAPLDKIESISNLDSTIFVRDPIYGVPDVVSQGVALISADLVHAGGNTGQGIKVGIIDVTGFDITNPEIKDSIVEWISFRMDGQIAPAGLSNHGGAVAETVNDVAPGAGLFLYNFNTAVEWLTLVQFLIDNRDLDIIVMSVSFFNAGPYDGTSFISQKIDDAKASGILWVLGVLPAGCPVTATLANVVASEKPNTTPNPPN